MKYAPKKVFIKVNNSYLEITNEEHEHLKSIDAEYRKRWFVPLNGYLMETDKAFYDDFYKDKRREKYILECAIENGEVSLEMLIGDDYDETNILIDNDEDVFEIVSTKIMVDKLRSVLPLLSDEEQEIIDALFYKEISEREWARQHGIPQRTMNHRKAKILAKLKELMKK